MSAVNSSIIAEINEICLVNDLAELAVDWIKTLRFTREKPSERNISNEDRSTTPQIYKYYFPENQVQIPAGVEAVGIGNAAAIESLRNAKETTDKVVYAPAIMIRSGETNIGAENAMDFEDVTVDFEIQVSEHDTDMRFQNLALAKNAIIHGLRTLKSRSVANYRLDWNIKSYPSDNENKPKAMMFISTTWRRFLPVITVRSLNDIK